MRNLLLYFGEQYSPTQTTPNTINSLNSLFFVSYSYSHKCGHTEPETFKIFCFSSPAVGNTVKKSLTPFQSDKNLFI